MVRHASYCAGRCGPLSKGRAGTTSQSGRARELPCRDDLLATDRSGDERDRGLCVRGQRPARIENPAPREHESRGALPNRGLPPRLVWRQRRAPDAGHPGGETWGAGEPAAPPPPPPPGSPLATRPPEPAATRHPPPPP